MENELLHLCQRLGQLPTSHILLRLEADEYFPFYSFEGLSWPNLAGVAGLCCLYHPAFDTCLLYVSHSGDLSRPCIPPRIRRIGATLGYRLYISPVTYYLPNDSHDLLQEPIEVLQSHYRFYLLLQLYSSNDVVFLHRELRHTKRDPDLW